MVQLRPGNGDFMSLIFLVAAHEQLERRGSPPVDCTSQNVLRPNGDAWFDRRPPFDDLRATADTNPRNMINISAEDFASAPCPCDHGAQIARTRDRDRGIHPPSTTGSHRQSVGVPTGQGPPLVLQKSR